MADEVNQDEAKEPQEPKKAPRPKKLAPPPKVAKTLADLAYQVMPHVPETVRARLLDFMAAGAVETLEDIKDATDVTLVRYRITSAIGRLVRDLAIEFYGVAASEGALGNPDAFEVYGIDITSIYPDCTAVWATRLRQAVSAAGMQNSRDISHRSAPARLETAFRAALRTENYGIDGLAFYAVLEGSD